MTQTAEARYPAEYEADVLLRDGSTVHLRPVRPDDAERLADLFHRLSPRSLYLRFHHASREITEEEAKRYTSLDYDNEFGLVATYGEPPNDRIIAIGNYYRLPESPDRAEVAFTVEDSHQGRGIATQLLDHLAIAARDHGITVFEADVLGENEAMMQVFRDAGYPLDAKITYGTYHLAFRIEETPESEQAAERREMIATTAGLESFFKPRSIAVVGASRERGTIGSEVFHNLLRHGFTGVVYPVNPKAEWVGGVKAYPSVSDIPDTVDLAIIIVPAQHVIATVEECAQKGVHGLVVISAGFRETGDDGRAREQELMRKARNYGMRVIGPNCMGILNAHPDVSMNATFSPVFPPFGNVALLSQSGALGLALLDYARDLNIGLSTFVSVGNKADVSGNDLIQYWEQDESTELILLYLESFGNPRKFGRLARRVSAKKPIVAVKSGRTSAGSRAAASHTGALASLDVASDALFYQAGVVRVDTLEQLFDVAALLAHQPLPKGRRVAVLTNAGGPGILAADACEAQGLEVARLSGETLERLREFLPAEAGLANPIDMIASATPEQYGQALRMLLEDDSIDSVIVIFIPPLVTQAEEVAASIHQAVSDFQSSGRQKTVLACFMSTKGAPPELSSEDGDGACTIPSYVFPEAAALALSRASEHAEWLARPVGNLPSFEVDAGRGRQIVEEAMQGKAKDEQAWLPADRCSELLEAYGIRSAGIAVALTPDEAAERAREMGFPVAVKLASATIAHKSDIGGVMLDVGSEDGVREAYAKIRERVESLGRLDEMQGVIVQQMAPSGIEAIVGVTQDPLFGPLIMFGLGGTAVELQKDVAFRIHPLTDTDAREMVRSIKGYPLLEGWRGSPPGDISALEELILRSSQLVEDLPEIAEMDLNPVKVQAPGAGCVVVDTRVLLGEPPRRRRR